MNSRPASNTDHHHHFFVDPRLLTRVPESDCQVPPASPPAVAPQPEQQKIYLEGDNELPPVPDCVYLSSPRSQHSFETLPGEDQNPPNSQRIGNKEKAEHTCTTCGKHFPRRSDLNKHVKTHQTHVCELCGRSLRGSKDFAKTLARHVQSTQHQKMLGQSGETSGYTCPVIWCGKTMPRRDNFKRHMRTQHPNVSAPD